MTYSFAVEHNGQKINGGQLFNTRKEAKNEAASLAIRIYEREGKFPNESELKIVRVY